MSEFVISTRYANALMSISEDNNSFEKVLEDVVLVKNTLECSKELRNILKSPIISNSKKAEILKELFGEVTGTDAANFLEFLASKGRENLLLDICKRFLAISDVKLNQVKVSISSAIELSPEQKNDINAKLESIINKKVIPSYNIDNSIIGGFKARYRDTVIDASVKHQLEILKKKLFEDNYLKN
jgi:F-type H+-transporting ATPase subunit delta